MSTARNMTTTLSPSDVRKWPLQIHHQPYGWSVVYYNADGHIKHVLTVDSEMQALRAARNLVQAYKLPSRLLLTGPKGEKEIDVAKLLH
jgi:hypothetical protein